MKKLVKNLSTALVLFGMAVASMPYTSAQSEVYIFLGKTHYISSLDIYVDDNIVYTATEKDIEYPSEWGSFFGKTEYDPIFAASKIKLLLNHDGKTLIRLKGKMLLPPPGIEKARDTSTYKKSETLIECQLNLTEGSVHYLTPGRKNRFKEMDPKKGEKEWNNKKYRELPEYIEQ